MLMTETALGRWAAIDDWHTIQGDRVLRTLFNIATMGGGPVTLATLARATGQSPSETLTLCQSLVRQGLVFDSHGDYLLTASGRGFVASLLAQDLL
jgi:DNA-binding IclR family transcriptional regulator